MHDDAATQVDLREYDVLVALAMANKTPIGPRLIKRVSLWVIAGLWLFVMVVVFAAIDGYDILGNFIPSIMRAIGNLLVIAAGLVAYGIIAVALESARKQGRDEERRRSQERRGN